MGWGVCNFSPQTRVWVFTILGGFLKHYFWIIVNFGLFLIFEISQFLENYCSSANMTNILECSHFLTFYHKLAKTS